MKNLKKVLALAVAFVMCFTMFAGAAVYSDVPAGSDYSEAVTLLSDLGVIAGLPDGSFGVDKTITRADAACLIARILTGETMPSKYAGASNFTDVPKDAYYESAVAYCAIEGITSGTGNGAYSPKREITDGEFIAMLTRALGYDSAENPLSFPMGNVSRAQQEGLLDGVNVVVDSPALRGEDAQMIYNALFADFDKYAKLKNIYQAADDLDHNYTIAEEVFGLCRLATDTDADDAEFLDRDERDRRSFKCKSHNWVVVGKDATRENTYVAFMIEDKDLLLDDGDNRAVRFEYKGDAESIMGYQVELWGDKDHTGTIKEVQAIKTVKGQSVYDYNPSMNDDDTNGKIKLADRTVKIDKDNTTWTHKLRIDGDDFFDPTDDAKNIVYEIEETTEEELNVRNGFTYKLMDWDSDDDIDFVMRTERYYGKVTSVDSEEIDIEAQNSIDDTFKIDDDNFKTVGDVAEDDIVEMIVTRAYDKKDKEVVTLNLEVIDPETHVYDSYTVRAEEYFFDNSDDPTYWAVEDADLTPDNFAASKYANWHIIDEPMSENGFAKDESYGLFLNENGYIIATEEADGGSGYLMVLDTKDGEKWKFSSKDKLAELEVLKDDNTVEKMEVTGSLKIDGSSTDNGYDKGDYRWDEKLVVGKVYKYYANGDGVITKMVSAVGNSNSDEKNDKANGLFAKNWFGFRSNTRRLVLDSKANGTANTYGGDNYSLTKDAPVFLTKPHAVANGGAAQGATAFEKYVDATIPYVQNDSDGDYWVDSKDVMVVKASKLPTINHSIDHNDDILPSKLNSTTNDGGDKSKGYYHVADTYMVANPDNQTFVAMAGEPSSKDNTIKVALFGVDSFKKLQSKSTIALITDVKVGSKNSTVYGAWNGKVEKTFKTVNGDPEDIFFGDQTMDDPLSQTDLTTLSKWFRDAGDIGRYAEVYTDSDGLITEVHFLEGQDGDKTVGVAATDDKRFGFHNSQVAFIGEEYAVVRVAVTYKDGNELSGMPYMVFDGNKYVSNEYGNNDTRYDTFDFASGINFYKINNEPGTRSSKHTMLVTDGYEADEDLYKSLKAATVADVKVSKSNNTDADRNTYYFADVAVNTDGKAVAIWSFDDGFKGTGETLKPDTTDVIKNGLPSTASDTKTAATPTSQETQVTVIGALEADETITLDINGNTVKVSFTTSKTLGASQIAEDVATKITSACAGDSITATAKNGVITITGPAGTPFEVFGKVAKVGVEDSFKPTAGDNIIFRVTKQSDADATGADAPAEVDITVDDTKIYKKSSVTVTIIGSESGQFFSENFAISGEMRANEVARELASWINSQKAALKVTVEENVVTVVDDSATLNNTLTVTIS